MPDLSFMAAAPVLSEYDAVIVGGGPAGWVAAVAAARGGCKTALIERNSFLGGAATAGLVAPISRFCLNGERVIGGITWEFVRKMEALGAAKVELPKGHISYDPEYYKLTAQRMALESGVRLYTNAALAGVFTAGRRVAHVAFLDKAGVRAVAANTAIDATGDAALCHLANVPMLPAAREMQPMSLCFILGGVNVNTPLLRDCIHHDGKTGASANAVIHDYLSDLKRREDVPQFGGPWFNTLLSGDAVAVNITRRAADAADPDDLTRAEMLLREDAFRLTELLRARFPEFRDCHILSTAAQGGVRETRRILGAHVLSGEELRRGERFPDTVALCAHPMDVHSASDDTQQVHALPCPGHVPFRCLYPEAFDNLLCAGRCVSADQEAFASLRVQATAMALGEAAGTAAARMKEGGAVSALDTEALRDTLKENGAIL